MASALIDASAMSVLMKKNLGKKRREHLAALLLDGHLGEEVLAP